MARIDIETGNVKAGVLGLVLALVEVIYEALVRQALRRVESGRLTPKEVERLGQALAELEAALEDIKWEQGLERAVRSVRDGLDDVVDDLLDRLVNPERWTAQVR